MELDDQNTPAENNSPYVPTYQSLSKIRSPEIMKYYHPHIMDFIIKKSTVFWRQRIFMMAACPLSNHIFIFSLFLARYGTTAPLHSDAMSLTRNA
jgi:hypothetical protein